MKSAEFYNERFDELERDNRKKEEKISWKKRQERWITKLIISIEPLTSLTILSWELYFGAWCKKK